MPYEKETAVKRDNHGSFGGGGRKLIDLFLLAL